MSLEDLESRLRVPSSEFRPEVRWWLAEGLHTTQTLQGEVRSAFELGFGGMEFLAMDEDAVDHARYGWGSEEWSHSTQVVVDETTRHGMGVSFTSGTNWATANLPTIDPDHPAAAKELNVTCEVLDAGATRSGQVVRVDPNAPAEDMFPPVERGEVRNIDLVAVVAVPALEQPDGSVLLDADRVQDLTSMVRDDVLEWTAPAAGPTDSPTGGSWQIFFFWMHGTGQTAAPSSTVNYAVNYLDQDGAQAVIDYWDSTVLTPELRARLSENPRTQMYMDSLELATFGAGGLLWGATVAEEFQNRHGYDVRPWLPFLTRTNPSLVAGTVYHHEPLPAQRETVEKVRFDLVHTFTDLYIENMLRPLAAFLHANNIGLRAEISYGMPFELTRPGPEVDGIETESFEFGSQIDAYRLMAGPAHLFGKQYSSETGATSRHHMLDHRFYDQIIATQLAAGVTKTVLHGWASTAGAEGATHWPGHEGMWSMFSERFDTRQPAAEFYPLWTAALARHQLLLRQGKPRIDVGILRTDHFVDATCGLVYRDDQDNRLLEEDSYGRLWMRNRQNHWWQDLGLQDAGWSYEFFDGELLLHDTITLGNPDDSTAGSVTGVPTVQPEGPGYQALIVYQEALDADVAALLLRWARQGLRVLLVNGARELKVLSTQDYTVHQQAAARTPGLDGRDEELAATMGQLRAEPTVAEVNDPAGTIDALRGLGLRGRVEFVDDNQNVLPHLRQDGDLTHLYLYHFLYETGQPTTVSVTIPGTGTAHRINAWTGAIRRHPHMRHEGGRTILTVDLHPGETALLTIDHSAPAPAGTLGTSTTREPASNHTDAAADADTEKDRDVEHVLSLPTWFRVVESWDAGGMEVITEDRGTGYQTREVRPRTAIQRLDAGVGPLLPWCDLPRVGPDVSGIGEYRTTFTLPEAPGGGRYVLELGSTAGGLGSVRINEGEAVGFDTSHPTVDITDGLRAGENTVRVRVASSLNNRLKARGYYDTVLDIATMIGDHEPGPPTTTVRRHGLLGPVRIIRENHR